MEIIAVERELAASLACAREILHEAEEIASAPQRLRPPPGLVRGNRPQDGPDDIAAIIDHTLLRPDATRTEIMSLCHEAISNRFGAVCVNSSNVSIAVRELAGSDVTLASTVGFPLGAASTVSKSAEAADATACGAGEIDMVINVGLLRSGLFAETLLDIAAVTISSSGRPVKVILENSLLDERQKIAGCLIARMAGASFVKTSTGFSGGGATEEDVRLMRRVVGAGMGVKASGGVRTLAGLRRMVAAGASRIGTSSSLKIVAEAAR